MLLFFYPNMSYKLPGILLFAAEGFFCSALSPSSGWGLKM